MNPAPGAGFFFRVGPLRVGPLRVGIIGSGFGSLLSMIIKRLFNNNVIITIGKKIQAPSHILFVHKIIMVNNGIKYVHLIKSMIQLYIVDSIT